MRRPGGLHLARDAIEKTAGGEKAGLTSAPDDLVKTIRTDQVSGGVGTIVGFAHDWRTREITRRSWDMWRAT